MRLTGTRPSAALIYAFDRRTTAISSSALASHSTAMIVSVSTALLSVVCRASRRHRLALSSKVSADRARGSIWGDMSTASRMPLNGL